MTTTLIFSHRKDFGLLTEKLWILLMWDTNFRKYWLLIFTPLRPLSSLIQYLCGAGLLHIPQIEAMQLVNVKGQLKYLSLMNIFFIYLPKEGALTMSIRQLEPSGPAITLFLIHAIIYTYGHLQSLVDWSYIHLQSSKHCKGEADKNGCLIANAMLLYLSPNLAIHHFFDEMTCLL